MNSHALIKVDTQQSWLERMLGARGARLLLVIGGTAALVLSIPSPLVEQIATSTGLNEISRLFEPPIGVGTRILLAGALALVPAAIVWALWAPRGSRLPVAQAAADEAAEGDFDFGCASSARPAQYDDDIGDSGEMMQAQGQQSGSAWSAIIRLVRGGFHDNRDDAALPRRRRDRHPDAPPRPPLFASRDLPPHEGRTSAPVLAEPEMPAPAPEVSVVAPLVFPQPMVFEQPQHVVAVAPPPRSPEPMSDAEIARIIGAMPPAITPPSEAEVAELVALVPAHKPLSPQPSVATSASASARPVMAAPLHKSAGASLLEEIDLPLIDGADLAALAARFERGLGRREVIVHAEEAQHSLDSRIAFVQPDPSVRAALRAQRPMDVVTAAPQSDRGASGPADPQPALYLAEDVEQALNSALATLRKLTEQGRR